MPADFDIQRIELMDEMSVQAMKRLGGTGRLRMLDELTQAGRLLMEARVREQHPDWTLDQIVKEVSRRLRDEAA